MVAATVLVATLNAAVYTVDIADASVAAVAPAIRARIAASGTGVAGSDVATAEAAPADAFGVVGTVDVVAFADNAVHPIARVEFGLALGFANAAALFLTPVVHGPDQIVVLSAADSVFPPGDPPTLAFAFGHVTRRFPAIQFVDHDFVFSWLAFAGTPPFLALDSLCLDAAVVALVHLNPAVALAFAVSASFDTNRFAVVALAFAAVPPLCFVVLVARRPFVDALFVPEAVASAPLSGAGLANPAGSPDAAFFLPLADGDFVRGAALVAALFAPDPADTAMIGLLRAGADGIGTTAPYTALPVAFAVVDLVPALVPALPTPRAVVRAVPGFDLVRFVIVAAGAAVVVSRVGPVALNPFAAVTVVPVSPSLAVVDGL